MFPLFTSEQMREADRFTIESLGIPEIILMEHAALAAADAVCERFGRSLAESSGLVLAGPGNNGGDAVAAARILRHRGAEVKVLKLGEALGEGELGRFDWIIDGIFGTGLSRAVEGDARKLIQKINTVSDRKWVVAIDVPSGLNADTGLPMGIAVKASETVTLGFFKRGLVTGEAADYTGALRLATIQIPREIRGIHPTSFLYTGEDARALPERKPTSHKGNFGHVFVWAGEAGKQGAACIAAKGALRAGAGLVTLFGKSGDVEGIRSRLIPEIMTQGWDDQIFTKLPKNAVVLLGPGMGAEADAWRVLELALKSDYPLVLDADALNLLGLHKEKFKKRSQVTILTPHPKEASRLLGKEVSEIQADRYRAHRELAETFGAHVILKGKGTIVGGAGEPQIVVTAGDTGLSKGGTGDLLCGIVGSILAQGLPPAAALPLASYLHGRASELVTQSFGHERSTLASDIAEILPVVFNELECRPSKSNP